MAMHANRPTQDQNFSVHFDGVYKTNGSIVQKNKGGGLGGRKALNDISNSGNPSALQPSGKHNTKNVIPIGEDLGVSKKSKAQVSGRKALGDLTNLVSPRRQKLKNQGKHSITVAEDENLFYSIAEEGFLHNHDECVKSQEKGMDLDKFLKTIGLHEGNNSHHHYCLVIDAGCKSLSAAFNPQPQKSKVENRNMFFDMEEVFEPIVNDRPYDGPLSLICGSPISPRQPCMMNMRDYDDFSSFLLIDSP